MLLYETFNPSSVGQDRVAPRKHDIPDHGREVCRSKSIKSLSVKFNSQFTVLKYSMKPYLSQLPWLLRVCRFGLQPVYIHLQANEDEHGSVFRISESKALNLILGKKKKDFI